MSLSCSRRVVGSCNRSSSEAAGHGDVNAKPRFIPHSGGTAPSRLDSVRSPAFPAAGRQPQLPGAPASSSRTASRPARETLCGCSTVRDGSQPTAPPIHSTSLRARWSCPCAAPPPNPGGHSAHGIVPAHSDPPPQAGPGRPSDQLCGANAVQVPDQQGLPDRTPHYWLLHILCGGRRLPGGRTAM